MLVDVARFEDINEIKRVDAVQMHRKVWTCPYRHISPQAHTDFCIFYFVSGSCQVDKLSYAALAEVKRHQVPAGLFLCFACDPTELSSIKSLHEEKLYGDETTSAEACRRAC